MSVSAAFKKGLLFGAVFGSGVWAGLLAAANGHEVFIRTRRAVRRRGLLAQGYRA